MTIELSADEWTVHTKETVSTGEYESAGVDVTLAGSVDGIHALDEDARKEIKARLLAVEKELQEAAIRYGENRKADEQDWGVSCE